MDKSVFISYSKYDRDAAFAIKSLLEKNHVRVWLDVISIKVSSQLLQELYNNIDRHETFCLLLSPTSVASPWCLKEIHYARSKDDLRFVPVILRSCKIPTDLENVVALDAREGLDHDSVRSRLLRALCGDGIVEDSIVFTQLQQDLLVKSQILKEGEDCLVDIKDQISALANDPITRLDLHVDVESLPVDGRIVELRLKLDIWKVAFSMFVSLYREAQTWPDRFKFEECGYTDFYRKKVPRVDARFRWIEYKQKMYRVITDDENLAEFYIEFDGHDFRPGGTLSIPTKFEVPCLTELAKHWSKFEIFLHGQADEPPELVSEETDIHLEVFGKIRERSVRLYRSNRSYKQQILVECPSILVQDNSIWKEVLVHGCDPDDTLSKLRAPLQMLRAETLKALDDRETDWLKYPFSSLEERRRVAHALYSRGGQDHQIHSQYRDAFRRFSSAVDLFQSLLPVAEIRHFDVLAYVGCHQLMIESCLRQRRSDVAMQLVMRLKQYLKTLAEANPHLADTTRLCADSCLLHAEILNNEQQKTEALKELNILVKLYAALYKALPSQQRRLAYIDALRQAIHNSQLWSLGPSHLIQEWTSAMHQEVGSEIASRLLSFVDPDVLPVWLAPITLPAWPVSRKHNDTLRYALNLPKSWIQEPLVRGTAVQIEHVYWGNAAQEADWLCIDFMGNARAGDHAYVWLESSMLLQTLPMATIHDDPKRGPKRRSWMSLGTLPGLKKRLKADEAYGWTGLFEYQRDYMLLGRIYALVVRRGRFAWKIVLSITTAVHESMEEKMLESNDHVRAGAVLGDLTLDGIPKATSGSTPAVAGDASTRDADDGDEIPILRSRRDVLSRKGHRIRSLADACPGGGPKYGALPSFQLEYFYGCDNTVD